MDPNTEMPPAYRVLGGGLDYPPSGAYPPPQGGVYPPPQGGAYPLATGGVQPGYQSQPEPQTVMVQQPNILVQEVLRFGELPQNIVCPKCQHTRTHLELGLSILCSSCV